MHLDVLDLRSFYYRTGLGRAAQRAIRDKMLTLWPEALGQSVVGFGFAAPLLRPYLADAKRVVALMPAQQGVMAWPGGAENVSTLCQELRWPLATGMADKVVMLHGLEATETPGALIEECWRVLGPGGRALFIVPNRAGLWSRVDGTPFGHGRPYSLGQLEALLRQQGFTPERHVSALYATPSQQRFWLRMAPLMEDFGRHLPFLAGGVLMVEASKQVYAPSRRGLRDMVRRPLRVLEGVPQPS
ncbi:MAG: class I SAM-dependent methyltransferase [Paracoccaceae bacterium]|jgi:SAM-dependent methyltransferase|nr:class I SAM-dependent methyltransferase [Paracoccaceae bacterium]MDP5345100.1 class I SAM-dependent methyltransferase [Paracoccaceae bacterium]